jgi:hypothetical protein
MAVQIETMAQSIFESVTYQVDTPEGVMFVTIIEGNSGKPLAIDIHVGKSGSTLRAWSQSFARMLTLALDNGATLNDLISELSLQRSDKSRTSSDGIEITSGPEGVCSAMMKYRADKFNVERVKLGILDDEDAARKGRGWQVEPLQRWGKIILVIYFDGDARGQIECQSEDEKQTWLKVIERLNSKDASQM